MAALMSPGYRSATEYRFGEDQTDAIVRTTAYHRKDYCLSVIWYSPREHVDIRLSIATPFRRTSNAGLGSLHRLPLELLYDALFRLDMHSLFKFRDKVYARDGFLEHFRWCEQAQFLWRSSGEGRHWPPELPEAARRGGYFNRRE